jgi:N-acetylneuraminic acid mutarotase
MKLIRIILFCFVLLAVMPIWVYAGWQYVAPMPNQRYGHDATLGQDGRVYVMGGMAINDSLLRKYNNGRYSNLVYDPTKDAWKVLEPVPGWIHTNYFSTYDPEKDQWDDVKAIPSNTDHYIVLAPLKRKGQVIKIPPERLRKTDCQRQGDGVAIVTGKDGRIYWIGGQGSWMGHGEDIVLEYDPVQSRWTEASPKRVYYSAHAWRERTVFKARIPPMNERRIDHAAAITRDGKIFVMGGRREELVNKLRDEWVGTGKIEVTNTVECYDPRKNKWEYKKPMTTERFLFAAVVGPDDRVYTFGGMEGYFTKTLDTTEVYDPETDTWAARKPMPEPRYANAAALGADGKIYVMGGSAGEKSPPVRDVFVYDPINDTWQKGPSMNLPRSTLAAVSTPDGKIYAIGGTDVGAYKNRERLNFLLPKGKELYDGRIQDTVEVLDIYQSK